MPGRVSKAPSQSPHDPDLAMNAGNRTVERMAVKSRSRMAPGRSSTGGGEGTNETTRSLRG